jgi:DNA replication protein DnaC
VNELVAAADEMTLNRTIAGYGRVNLLCIDGLGYLEPDKRGAELLFQVLTEREENSSVAIASDESFSGWTRTFTDPRLCAAIVDRRTFGGNMSRCKSVRRLFLRGKLSLAGGATAEQSRHADHHRCQLMADGTDAA